MITWRKSSRSGGGGSGGQECVEVAQVSGAIGVRDSTAPDAGHLSVSTQSFADLVARVKRDELDL
ncbi:DUF397 domain-containing protein [Actinomadura rudentiformis]|uniref:DUF397 domain-containing protein n=1 Tax=Actinomadura rudentiformis TaxID=359158 RepID=A0A6H9YE40_9ACTN|nr:DUF397 domain-containing protein [Actinomadura rudentiformis]KAB2342625.1 DUF397 domain-containing protein [Actinomadura rudentiformis]